MRRMLGLSGLVAMVTLVSSVALAVDDTGTYRDEFASKSYEGSDGTEYWGADPWKELGDDGAVDTGSVYIDQGEMCAGSKCLQISSEGSEIKQVGAKRSADTSVFESFELCYEVGYQGDVETDAVLRVEKSVDGGDTWHILADHHLYDGFSDHPALWIGGPYESTIVRFTVTGVLHGVVFIDDVELKGKLLPGSISTTSTTSSSTTTTTTVVKSTTTTKVDPTTTSSRPVITTTTSTSTTTTTRPETPATTTTTISPRDTTTTTGPTTTSTSPTTTSTSPTTTSTSPTTTSTRPKPTTTTTQPETTSTSEALIVPGNDDPGDGGSPPPADGGIRQTARGIQASFDGRLFGDMPLVSEISGVDHRADYRMAAEVIEASWVWLVILALVLAWSIVSGLEKRRGSTRS